MSFAVTLMRNNSPSNFVTKTVSEVLPVTGVLRAGTSLLDPTIIVETDAHASVIANANYAYIEAFYRYYYITNIETDANGLWVISMHVDVLMTYADKIRSQNAIISRQEFVYNMYLDDGWFMAYQNPLVQYKYLSETAPFESEEYVLVIAGS